MSNHQCNTVYAAYSNNESERLVSSSGGIFALLAKIFLSKGGVIYGVAISSDCRKAEFIRVVEEERLEKLRTSKYLQAHVGHTFNQVKKDLETGLTVLFTGTGCQINGLIGFLGAGRDAKHVWEKYSSLYCVDVICHGAPSPILWRKYVEYMEEQHNGKLVGINFRCKDDSWTDFGMKETLEDCSNSNFKKIYISKDEDPYMQMFLRDYCLRPSCYECRAKKTKLSDITLADFWGINNICPEMNDGKGVSLVLVRTEKGRELFDHIKAEIVYKEVSYEDGVRSNPAEYSSAKRPVERDIFFGDMDKMDFEDLKNKYAAPKPVSIKRRIKNQIKRIVIKTPASKLIGGGGIK